MKDQYFFQKNTNTFNHMKRNSILINVSRGKLVKEDALVEALRSGLITAAGPDVFEEEPLPKTSELWTMDIVVMTPHLGGQGDYNKYRLASLFEENIQRFLEGKDLKYVVDIGKDF